ncbi:hypothetical protein IT412_03245 [Candidatus Peregrinibacteria bacterium]|nr:hypothetical protein [Candidatus Peregrinibacteria bacterium]
MKTPTTMTVEAFNAGTTGLTAYELRYDGGETYDDTVPVEIDFTVSNGPRILVATGYNGIDAKLLNSAVAHPLYNADITNVSECQGALVKSQGCDHKIAKDLWCTLHANEQSNCSITTAFASLSNVKAYVVGNPGNTKVAWDVRCMQLPKHLSFSTSNLPRVATEFHRSIVQERSSVTPTVGQKTKSLSPRRSKISVGVF